MNIMTVWKEKKIIRKFFAEVENDICFIIINKRISVNFNCKHLSNAFLRTLFQQNSTSISESFCCECIIVLTANKRNSRFVSNKID